MTVDRDVRRVWLTVLILGAAYGVSIALTPLHLHALGYSKGQIGQVAAVFAAGIVSFSMAAGWLVRRARAGAAKWTLVAALLLYALAVTLFPHLDRLEAVAAVRLLDGVASVTVWVGAETILLARSSARDKAHVMSVYAVCMASGYIVGPLLARGLAALTPSRGVAFAVAGVLALTAAAVAALTLDTRPLAAEPSPGLEHPAATPWTELLWTIKTSCLATFSYGYFQASVVLFLPLFLMESKGIAAERTVLIPAFFAAGMLLLSNPAARLADRVGHLRVMRGQGSIGLLMILGFVFLDAYVWMAAAVFVAGGTLAAISPVSLALQGVVVPAHDYGRANGIYNAAYAVGMLLGPPVSSLVFMRHGGEGMLLHLAGMWVAFVLFAWVFRADDPAHLRGKSSGLPALRSSW